MVSKKILFILLYVSVISSFLIVSMASNNSLNEPNRFCNDCHGPTAAGHISVSLTVLASSTVEAGTPTTISATIQNNGYPFNPASLTLESSPVISFTSGSSAKIDIGSIGRGASQTVTWNVIFHASSDMLFSAHVTFSGFAFASSHMQYTYTSPNPSTATIHISTTPVPILQVQSNPLPQSTLYVGSTNNTGTLVIKNAGQVDMPNVTVQTNGPVLVNNETSFTITNIPTGSSVSFPITIDTSGSGTGTITVKYMGTFLQESIINIFLRPNPADSFELFVGRVFGYLAYILLFLSVVAGAGIYHLKKYISGRKIRILHSDLANLSFTMVIIHAITLTIPNSPWSNAYYFFELLPERIPYDIGTLGMFLGRSALVLMYISVFSGFYLAKLIKRYGKKVGISIHMLSYVALIFGFVHTILIGGWANSSPTIILLLTVSVLSVGFLKWDAQRMLNQKKRNYEKRKLARKLASKQESVVSSTEQ